jgi:hypothetical protein
MLLLGPGGWCPRKYCSHAGLLYEAGFGSSRLCRQAPLRLLRRERPLAEKEGTVGEKCPVADLGLAPRGPVKSDLVWRGMARHFVRKF